MNTHADQIQENKSQAVSAVNSKVQSANKNTFQFVDNRPEAVRQRKLQEMADNSPQVSQLRAFQNMANKSPQAKKTAQLQSMADNHSAQQQKPIQKKENNMVLTDNLITGMVNVIGRCQSPPQLGQTTDKPAQLQAHVYAQGTDIHLGAGPEKHLPHEAWHVIQQKQGRVKPTRQMKEKVNINDDAGLEKEANVMGKEAFQRGNIHSVTLVQQKNTENTAQLVSSHFSTQIVQRVIDEGLPKGTKERISEDKAEKTEEKPLETFEQVIPQDYSTLSGHINAVIQKDDWNNAVLVEKIGRSTWGDIKAAWDRINHDNKKKLTLVKLRGKPYNETDDDLISYEGWSDNFIGKQSGNKWGTETEGGGITLSLKSAHQGKDKEAKEKLKAALSYFKRTALMETDTHKLALDNVHKIDELLVGEKVSMPIEVASKPMYGAPSETDKEDLLKKEQRKFDNWPTLKISGTNLAVKNGQPKAIDKFNEYFVTYEVKNIKWTQKPQHVTKSGQVEDRLNMANELNSTAKSISLGTKGKSGLSGKAKTSLEFLRHSSLNQKQVKAMEKAGHQMRTSLRKKFKKKKTDIKFADEELNGIIVPVTGVPREIGGYTLATPMTNVFPLLDKGGGKVTTLREYR